MLPQIISMLVPPIVAMGVFNHLHQSRLSNRQLLLAFAAFTIIVNVCVYLVLIYIFNIKEISFQGSNFIKYLLFATTFSIIMPLVANAIGASVTVEVKRGHGKKKS